MKAVILSLILVFIFVIIIIVSYFLLRSLRNPKRTNGRRPYTQPDINEIPEAPPAHLINSVLKPPRRRPPINKSSGKEERLFIREYGPDFLL